MQSVQVNIHEAKTHLSRLLERSLRGDDVVIAKAGRPIVRLVLYEDAASDERTLGRYRDEIAIGDDFDAPLPDDLLEDFDR